MKNWVLTILGLVISCATIAQSPSPQLYWIFFTDKPHTHALSPDQLLSPAAWENRHLQGIALDHRDYPVDAGYLRQVANVGGQMGYASRWFNAVAASLDAGQLAQVARLPFVKQVRPITTYTHTARTESILCADSPHVGTHVRQLSMLGVDQLHRAGFDGQGIRIAVMDNGFDGVDELPGFAHLFDQGRILATRDYVDGDTTVFHGCNHCRHGTYVFSILASVMPGELIGSAPGASYMLLRTENDASETPQEEVNWIAAAEFADSMGANILTTSLGYGDFDGSGNDYTAEEYDGHTPLITRGADIAASKGMLVINSAGNNGRSSFYPGLNAPADGDSVLAIGSVDACEAYSAFSSRGPRVDGMVKPDLVAMGELTYFLHPNGTVRVGNGTSFSCPLVTGLAACLMQAFPEASSAEMLDILRQAGDRYAAPSGALGYGIPRAETAWELLEAQGLTRLEEAFPQSDYQGPFDEGRVLIYPNPSQAEVYLSIEELDFAQVFTFSWRDLTGRRVMVSRLEVEPGSFPLAIPSPESAGVFLLEIQGGDAASLFLQEKIVLTRP